MSKGDVMKRIMALILAVSLALTACASNKAAEQSVYVSEVGAEDAIASDTESDEQNDMKTGSQESEASDVGIKGNPEIETVSDTADYQKIEDQEIADENLDLSDERLQQYLKDKIYLEAIENFDSDEYVIDSIETTYYSKEYIENLAYNSQENLYFGFTQAELDQQFAGKKYVFTLGDDGKTTVTEVEAYEDHTTEEVLKNVAIGSGVLLVCVTVSVATGGVAPAVSMIFAVGAKAGTAAALSGGVIGGVSAGIVKGYQTGNFEDAMLASAAGAGEGFKWGAITGVLSGGASEAWGLYKATANGLSINQVAVIQKESKYPLDLIKQFKSVKEYEIYKNAGLKTQMVNGKLALVRDIEVDYRTKLPDGTEVTNLERMLNGKAPIDPATGKTYQLHHINQDPNGTLAILKEAEHQGNSAILNNPDIIESQIDRNAFKKIRVEFWKSLGNQLATLN